MFHHLKLCLIIGHLVLERNGQMVFDLDCDLLGDLKSDLCFDLLFDLGSVRKFLSSGCERLLHHPLN